MKNFWISLLIGSCSVISLSAQDKIVLPQVDKSVGSSLMEALANRKSVRTFSDKDLSDADLANLLWAANGVNRTDGKRTAPSAIDARDIDVYVCRADGAFRYDAENHQLIRVSKEDLRNSVANGQEFAAKAPVSLVLVSDGSHFGSGEIGLADAGYVSQNICLFCAATGLATVPRGTMDVEALKAGLKLKPSQKPMLNNPVGYPQ